MKLQDFVQKVMEAVKTGAGENYINVIHFDVGAEVGDADVLVKTLTTATATTRLVFDVTVKSDRQAF